MSGCCLANLSFQSILAQNIKNSLQKQVREDPSMSSWKNERKPPFPPGLGGKTWKDLILHHVGEEAGEETPTLPLMRR